MFARLCCLVLTSLSLAACDDAAMSDLRRNIGLDPAQTAPAEPTGPRPPAVSPLDQPIETGAAAPRPVATAEPLTYRSAAFLAAGNEPFWAIEVGGDSALYRTPENQQGRRIPVRRIVFDRGVEFIGVVDGRPFVINLTNAECRDSMDGDEFPLTARLTITGQTRMGCATPAAAASPAAAG